MNTSSVWTRLWGAAAVLLCLSSCASLHKPAAGTPASKVSVAWDLEGFEQPESAYYHASTKTIYVSNVAGDPTGKDGKGWISRVSPDGKLLEKEWVTGLNAPKGLRAQGGTLWVSDIDDVVAIDIASGKISQKIHIKGAKFLNDVAVAADGSIFVSDMLLGAIYRIRGGVPKIWRSGEAVQSPNGLLVVGGQLWVAAWGKDIGADFKTPIPGQVLKGEIKNQRLVAVTPPLGNLDGIEIDEKGRVLVSDWMAGLVFRVLPDSGQSETLISGIKGAADLAYIAETKHLILPRMMENRVTAYVIRD